MDSCIFNVFRDGVGDDLSPVGDGIEFYFLGSLVELAHHDWMLLGNLGGQRQEMAQLLFVMADVHGRTGQHVRRSHEHRESDSLDESLYVVHGGKFLPFRLVDSKGIHNA